MAEDDPKTTDLPREQPIYSIRTVRVYPRDEIQRVIETEGGMAALKRWPKALHLIRPMAIRANKWDWVRKDRMGRWQPEWDALLGTKNDLQLSLDLGVSISMVNHRRRKLNIPSAGRHSPLRARVAALTDEQLQLPAWQLNELLGCKACGAAVAKERKLRGMVMPRGVSAKIYDEAALRRAAVAGMLASAPEGKPVNLAHMAKVLNVSRERVRVLAGEVIACVTRTLAADRGADEPTPPLAAPRRGRSKTNPT